MSWSASYPAPASHPPRRSRSRSPDRYRGGYPPPRQHSDMTAYPPTGADYPRERERDWEQYQRQREWDNYERERAEWEWRRAHPSGRGRSRSPILPDEDRRLKRRRSPSPYERDRYDPRPRYGDDFDTHSRAPPGGYTSPPRRSQYQPQRSRAPPDPHLLDYPATFKHYSDWHKATFPEIHAEDEAATREAEREGTDTKKVGIRARYDKYRKQLNNTQVQILFDHHKKSAWFVEKYDLSPAYVQLRARVRAEGWKGRVDQFISELEDGRHDPTADDPPPVSTTPMAVSPIRENVEIPPTDDVKPAEDDLAFGMEADDEPPEPDSKNDTNGRLLGPGGRPRGSDEVSIMPEGNQVMIRTIPPDIGRLKIEEACSPIPGFKYLALGDPLQKRHYYRAGWIKFDDETDMAKAVAEISEKKIEGFKLHVSHSTRPFFTRIRVAPALANRPERLEKDLVQAKKLASILEEEAANLAKLKDGGQTNVEENSHIGTESDAKDRGSQAVEKRIEKLISELPPLENPDEAAAASQSATKTAIALDLYRAYLRTAFNTCYYCACVTDHVEELVRKCVKHVRKTPDAPAGNAEAEGERDRERDKERERARGKDEQWPELVDSKIALLISREGVDPREYGGKSYDEELSKAVEVHIKQEDEGKFRCRSCNKLFKATAFVEKHVANKHPELVKSLEEIPYFNNFALDPLRIQPFLHPPHPTGNGQQAPPQAYGLPGHSYSTDTRYGQHYAPPPLPGYGHYSNGGSYAGYPPPPPYYRGEPPARRLSDRMGGYAVNDIDLPLPVGVEGLPAKPVGAETTPSRRTDRNDRAGRNTGPPPPPPPDAREDPRATAGKKVSYHDMDEVAEGDIELTY